MSDCESKELAVKVRQDIWNLRADLSVLMLSCLPNVEKARLLGVLGEMFMHLADLVEELYE